MQPRRTPRFFHIQSALRGTAFGVFNLLSGVVTLVSSVVAGILWDRVGAAATFYAGAGFSMATIVLLVCLRGSSVAAQDS